MEAQKKSENLHHQSPALWEWPIQLCFYPPFGLNPIRLCFHFQLHLSPPLLISHHQLLHPNTSPPPYIFQHTRPIFKSITITKSLPTINFIVQLWIQTPTNPNFIFKPIIAQSQTHHDYHRLHWPPSSPVLPSPNEKATNKFPLLVRLTNHPKRT